MSKKKTSKKHKNYKKLMPFHPGEILKKSSPKEILNTLIFCIEEDDYDTFKEVLTAYLSVHNKARIAKAMGVSRRALYHMISKDGNPTIQSLIKFYQAIKKAA